uniref:HhH-GPD domain-containing protein n=1 Tax=Kalanchoe fedtschenkoi TaxID=63787 RepID=A0A7N0V4K7_KALFE
MAEPLPTETLIHSDSTNGVETNPDDELTHGPIVPTNGIFERVEIGKLPSRPRKFRKVETLDGKPAAEEGSTESQLTACSSSLTGVVGSSRRGAKSKLVPQRVLQVVPRIEARSLMCEGEIEFAIRHLRNADPLMAGLIDVYPRPTFDEFRSPFHALTKSILYQQLAFKAGASVYSRFVGLCGGEDGVVPETVLALDPQQLRQIGVSGRKASYLHDLARKYRNGILSDSVILALDDKSLFTMLTMVNGIGSWSVHMFMIFSLHRPDVLPVNDLGVRKGVQHLYGLEELPRPSQMDQLCEKWRPYRSVASWYLWRFNEAKGAAHTPLAASIASLQQQQQQQQQLEQQQQHFLDPNYSILNVSLTWGQ